MPEPDFFVFAAGTAVRSFKAMELVSCAEDKERSGLAKQRVKRLLAPQTMETPLYFHAIHSDSASFRNAVDQLHQVGFDMIFYSFGSGFDLEAVAGDPKRLQQLKEDVAYANALGVEVGGYDLICWTRKVKDEWAALVKHSQGYEGACFASGWYDHLLSQVIIYFRSLYFLGNSHEKCSLVMAAVEEKFGRSV